MRKLNGIVAVCVFLAAGAARGDLIAHWRLDEPAGTAGEASIMDSGPGGTHHGTPDFMEDSPVTFGLPGANAATGTCCSFAK